VSFPDGPRARVPQRHWRTRSLLIGIALLSLVTLMATLTPLPVYRGSPRVKDGRFTNIDPDRPVTAKAKDYWEFFFNKPKTTVPDRVLPIRTITSHELHVAPDRSLYRLGHSTLLLKLRGKWWLTDPVFAERASPVQWAGPKRFHAPPIALQDLPAISGVLLSHDHYDHLDRNTVRTLAKSGTRFYTPLGVGDRLIAWGIPAQQVQQFDWWQGTTIEGLQITATPAQHFSGRSFGDGNRTLWASWVVQDGDLRLFFSGDSGYFSGFKAIGRKFGPFDATFIETGAYDSNWPNVHMQPEESVQAHIDLQGRWMLPIHNGTFDLSMHGWQDPFERVIASAKARGVRIMTPQFGEGVQLDAPHVGSAWWRD